MFHDENINQSGVVVSPDHSRSWSYFPEKYIRGVVLASLAVGAAYYLVSMAIDRATQIVEKILSGEVPLTVAAITELVSLQSANENLHLLNYVSTGLVICWVFAVVDSWRAGEQITSLKD